jgi:lysophospholipase L1-like esterase
MPSATEQPIRIPTRRKILYLGVLVVLLLGLFEGGLRLRAWIRYGSASTAVRDPMMVHDEAAGLWVPRPGYEVKGAKIHIRVNSLGFRGPEFSRVKPAGTFRIVVLGASTTFSAEASSNDVIWTVRLQEKLNEAAPDRHIEVINAGVPGYSASENLRNLKHRVLPLDPDLVIYYEANNEIARDTRELAIGQRLTDSAGNLQPSWARALSRVSLLFDLAYKNLAIASRSRDGGKRRIDRVPPELPQRFIGILGEMKRELAARNVPLVLSTFVVKYRRDQARATQIANADVSFYYMPWMSIDGLLDAMDTYNAAIIDYGRREGLPVVDDRNAVPPDADHFVDCMHFADKGNEAMAERFSRGLRALGIPPPPR